MALQTNLSKKDKMTIAILLFSAVVFMIIWFLIKPTITSIITTTDKIEQAEITQTQYKNKIIYLSSAEAIYGKTVEELNESTADYYEIMDSSEIDKKVTSYVLKAGLFSESLTINMPSDSVEESPYTYSDDANTTKSSSESSSKTSTGADTLLTPYSNARNNCSSTKSSGVKCVSLTLVVTGSRSKCQAFIDDICTKPAIRVTGFDWGKLEAIEVYNEETRRVELVTPTDVRLRININLYMADVADYSTAVAEPAA